MVNDSLNIKGKIIIFKKDNNNNWYKVYETCNLIVDSGLAFLAQILNGAAVTDMGWIAVGTDATIRASTDTALLAEIARKAITTQTVISNIWRVDAIFNPGEGTGTWREAGIFNASSAGTMLNRVNINFVKTATEAVRVRFQITFNA